MDKPTFFFHFQGSYVSLGTNNLRYALKRGADWRGISNRHKNRRRQKRLPL